MNLGSQNATNIKVYYYDANGTRLAVHTIASASNPLAPYTKANTNPAAAGALRNGSFGYSGNGGAIEIISDQPVVALIRAAIWPNNIRGIDIFGEDYNALTVTP